MSLSKLMLSMKWKIVLVYWCISVCAFAQETNYQLNRIGDEAPHSAFTDLVRYKDKFYCAFREGTGHIPEKDNSGNGNIRILVSEDGGSWTSAHLIVKEGCDLRDPKLSVTPDNRLMILIGGSFYDRSVLKSRLPHVVFMDKKGVFSEIKPVSIDPVIASSLDWLWRITWHKKTGYATVYRVSESKQEDWKLYLVKTNDGINYQLVTQLQVEGKPNESSIEIHKNQMTLVVRREGGDFAGYIGKSTFPFTDWKWKSLGIRLGGPNLIRLPDDKLILGTRSYYGKNYRTSLYEIEDTNKPNLLVEFPSNKDTGYPGLVRSGKNLWVSYNSGHEEKTAVYLAKFPNWKRIKE